MIKKYINVFALFDANFGIIPMSIRWLDGKEYQIDKVLDVRNAASTKVGGFGIRYTVRIKNKQRFLWLEENKWFVEAPDEPEIVS